MDKRSTTTSPLLYSPFCKEEAVLHVCPQYTWLSSRAVLFLARQVGQYGQKARPTQVVQVLL